MNNINKATLDLIKSFEGLELTAYKDPVGVWTIGYGHTDKAGPPSVRAGMRITAREAEEMLLRDLKQYRDAVDKYIRVDLNDNQYGALVSFCYNVGPGNFAGSSVVDYVNAKRFKEVPGRLALWNKGGGKVLKGLTRRREAEGKLFLTPAVASSKPVRPLPDNPGVGDRVSPPTTVWGALLRLLANIFGGKNV